MRKPTAIVSFLYLLLGVMTTTVPNTLVAQSLVASYSPEAKSLYYNIEHIITDDAFLSSADVTGLSIAVIDHDSSYIFGYGETAKGSAIVPDENSIFEISNVTKVFTALLVEALVQEGKLHLDSTANRYLHLQNAATKDITLRQLLTHTSGLPKMPTDFGSFAKNPQQPFAEYSQQDLFAFYKEYTPLPNTQGKYLFSNVNYGILELIIENKLKTNYKKLVLDKIVTPLGLKNTQFDYPPTAGSHFVVGYDKSGAPATFWRMQSFQASEGLKSTPRDLLHLLEVQLHATSTLTNPLEALLQAAAEAKVRTDIDPNTWAAAGWHVLKKRKRYSVVAASGNTEGCAVFIGFVKETRTGVVILANSSRRMSNLGYLVLQYLNGGWKRKK
jgi:CubicO group peptidase (beta-lactamase class C family)